MMCSIEERGSTRDMYPEAPEYGIYIFAEDEVKPGDDAIKALGLDDTIVEYEITNNRVDCFSIPVSYTHLDVYKRQVGKQSVFNQNLT